MLSLKLYVTLTTMLICNVIDALHHKDQVASSSSGPDHEAVSVL